MSATPGVWQEARNAADGRVYYYHTGTKATQWTKPVEMMSPTERALANQPWKEYTAEGGRKYWYNTETKQSSWEMPDVYKEAVSQPAVPAKPSAPVQQFVAGGGSNFPSFSHQKDQVDHYNDRDRDRDRERDRGDRDRGERGSNYRDSDGLRSSFVSTSNTEPEYSTFEEAEGGFMKLLKRSGIQADWTWEQTMRAIIKDPQYRALKDPKDRKAAFEKYVVESRQQDKEREKERVAKLRLDFGSMLKTHPEIKHYTRWKTARPIIEGETIFRSTSDDTERRQLFEEFILDLKRSHAENETNMRKAALEDLVSVLKSLDLEPYTRWSDAEGIIDSSEQFQSDAKFKTLTKSDVLTAFENHIKALERTFNDARQLQKTSKQRRERQNRDQFVALLAELKTAGKIKAGTKWMDLHDTIENDPRYVAVLGQSGSTPLDLFWDMVEEEERALRGKRNEVLDVLDDKRYEITPKTSIDEFMTVMHSDRRTTAMSPDDLELIFLRLHAKIQKRTEEDKHHLERQQRRAIDALRSRIKHLEPPVHASDTWDQVRTRVERYEEYRAVTTDELRRSAFDKVVRRLKEKDTDVEHADRARRRDERGESRSNGHHRGARGAVRHSRSPEPDAYEADRRKAQADRERSYRKGSVPGLSPPALEPSSRRRDDRERDRERDRDERDRYDRRALGRPVPGGMSPYERERRDREAERENRYMSRADPREVGAKELDYGDSRAGSMNGSTGRKRRESEEDGESGRKDSKRLKRDKRSKTPADLVEAKEAEEKAVRSGSEEGEIEED